MVLKKQIITGEIIILLCIEFIKKNKNRKLI